MRYLNADFLTLLLEFFVFHCLLWVGALFFHLLALKAMENGNHRLCSKRASLSCRFFSLLSWIPKIELLFAEPFSQMLYLAGNHPAQEKLCRQVLQFSYLFRKSEILWKIRLAQSLFLQKKIEESEALWLELESKAGEEHKTVILRGLASLYEEKEESRFAIYWYAKLCERCSFTSLKREEVFQLALSCSSFFEKEDLWDQAIHPLADYLSRKDILEDSIGVTDMFHRMGILHGKKGNHEIAKDYLEKTLKNRIELFGENHPLVGFTLGDLGSCMLALAKNQEASKILRSSVKILKSWNDSQKSLYLAHIQDNLALSLLNQKKMGEAERVMEEAHRMKKEGVAHPQPSLFQSYWALARLKAENNKKREAKELYRQCLEMAISTNAQKNLVLDSRIHLWRFQKDSEEEGHIFLKEKIQSEIWEILSSFSSKEEALSVYPDLLFQTCDFPLSKEILFDFVAKMQDFSDEMKIFFLITFSRICHVNSDFNAACFFIDLCIEKQKNENKNLEVHPDLADLYLFRSLILEQKEDLEGAILDLDSAYEIRSQIPEEQTASLLILESKASLLFRNEKTQEALWVLSRLEKILLFRQEKEDQNSSDSSSDFDKSADSLFLARIFEKKAEIAWENDEAEQADFYLQKTMQIRIDVLGEDHLDLVPTLNILCELRLMQARPLDGLALARRSLEIVEKNHGKETPDFLSSLYVLSVTMTSLSMMPEAKEIFERQFAIVQEFKITQPYILARLHSGFAGWLEHSGDFETSLFHYALSLDFGEEAFGEDNEELCETRIRLLDSFRECGFYDQAIKGTRVLLSRMLSENKQETLDFALECENLGDLYLLNRQKEEAVYWFLKAIEKQTIILGDDHSHVQKLKRKSKVDGI